MGFRVDTSATLVLDGYGEAEVDVTIGVPISALVEWDAASESGDLRDQWTVFLKWAKPTWDLEDAAGAIPVEESLGRLPKPVMVAILRAWRNATVNPPAPLPPPSVDGEP